MDELLKQLFESELLTADKQQELIAAFNTHLAEQVELAKSEESVRVKTELTEQWITEREMLIEAIDSKVDDFLVAEMSQFKGDVERFRDLEAEYAGKLVEAKAEMAIELQSDMASLLTKLDEFLEERLAIEFDELREDLETAKRDRFGRQIFEAFQQMFSTKFVDEDSIAAKLHEQTEKNADLEKQLLVVQENAQKIVRESKMTKILAPLGAGRKYDIMETILATTPTDKLEETYQKYIGRVLNESVDPAAEKEDKRVLAEGEQLNGKKIIEENFKIKTGDTGVDKPLNESTIDAETIQRLKLLSGQL